nr:hypothetical protein A152_19870 [Vibrio tasmaniensis 1F-187]
MNYQQLTEGRRYQIPALLERGISVSEIAKTVQCHRGVVDQISLEVNDAIFDSPLASNRHA